jgi:RNA polymerase sigma factor for flagellar operon FliA
VSEALVEYAATRDVGLRNQLVLRHLPLVKFVARKMSSNLPENVDLDDLVSWGSIGLIDALEKFEPERGWQFSTYAVNRIRGEILDGLQRMEWAPKQITSQVRRLKRVMGDLQHELNREPTNDELAARLDIDVATVRSIRLDASQRNVPRPLLQLHRRGRRRSRRELACRGR